MAKYISAEIAKKALADSNLIPRYAESCKPITDRIIDSLTAADVEPVRHERWCESKNFDVGFWVCSNCSFTSEAIAAHKLYIYCPNCGAKMDKEVFK